MEELRYQGTSPLSALIPRQPNLGADLAVARM